MKLFYFLLAFAFFKPAVAQEARAFSSTIYCFPSAELIKVLSNEYKEEPIFSGDGSPTKFVLFTNNNNGSWTMVGFENNHACIIAAGKKHQMVTPKGI